MHGTLLWFRARPSPWRPGRECWTSACPGGCCAVSTALGSGGGAETATALSGQIASLRGFACGPWKAQVEVGVGICGHAALLVRVSSSARSSRTWSVSRRLSTFKRAAWRRAEAISCASTGSTRRRLRRRSISWSRSHASEPILWPGRRGTGPSRPRSGDCGWIAGVAGVAGTLRSSLVFVRQACSLSRGARSSARTTRPARGFPTRASLGNPPVARSRHSSLEWVGGSVVFPPPRRFYAAATRAP